MRKLKRGTFQAIDSFAIRKRNEFYLIGELLEGDMHKNWFVNIPLNSKMNMACRITEIEEIETSQNEKIYNLLVVSVEEEEEIDFLLSMNIGNEPLEIAIADRTWGR